MTAEFYIPFLVATAILLATPGPTILMVVSYALAQGRGVALAVVGGVLVGDFLAMTITQLGLGALLAAAASLSALSFSAVSSAARRASGGCSRPGRRGCCRTSRPCRPCWRSGVRRAPAEVS